MATVAGILLGLGFVAWVAVAIGRRAASRDLGSVSRVWIVEQRAGERDERR